MMFNGGKQVSIIMPTYNRAKLIGESIQSIINQTYQNWQLIIVDDGSEDDTDRVVFDFKENRIEFIKTKRTGIGGRLKNIGLQKATGELIAFLDSDDLWHPTKLEKQVHALMQYPDAGFCLVGGYNFKTINVPIDFFYKTRTGLKYGDVYLDFFKSEVSAFTQALMLRKESLAVVNAFKEQKMFSDADFLITLAMNFKAVIVYEPLVFRRIHNTNWIDNNWIKSYYEGKEMIDEHKHRLPKPLYRDALFRLFINFGESYLQRGKRSLAIGKFIGAWRYRPLTLIPLKKIAKSIIG